MDTTVASSSKITFSVQEFEKARSQSLNSRKEGIEKRRERLKNLLRWVQDNRGRIQKALAADSQKPALETDVTEIYPVIGEIKHALKNLEKWSRPKKIDAPLNYLGTWSEIRYEPKGVCLILSPWNFPFNLCVGPLVSCLAAGNVAVLKPSEVTPHTSRLIFEMASEIFPGKEVQVVEGDVSVARHLLSLPFDHIFFTGSPSVGKQVMKAAAANLASVTLELGGKSPAIVHSSASVKDAGRRLAFGKFLNNGQTCIAPDYVLVHESLKENLIKELKDQVLKIFGESNAIDETSGSYGRVINERHFRRLKALLEEAIESGARPELSGKMDEQHLFFHPVILSEVSPDSRIMEEEIFGPLLPVFSYRDEDEPIRIVNNKPKPLALYIFGHQRAFREKVLRETTAGSVCVNDCVIQFMHPNLPFGGVNNSGIGKSHGYHGFLAFSNEKPVLRQKRGFTLSYFFYPPFTRFMKKQVDFIMRWF